jgi:hypothetical protein
MKHLPTRTPLLDRPMTDAQRIAIEDQSKRLADEQLKAQVSADARHIVKCACEDAREVSGRLVKLIWIIFVLLPVVLGILFVILKL